MSAGDHGCDVCPGRGLHLVDLRDGGDSFFLCGACTDDALALGAQVVVIAS